MGSKSTIDLTSGEAKVYAAILLDTIVDMEQKGNSTPNTTKLRGLVPILDAASDGSEDKASPVPEENKPAEPEPEKVE